MRLTRSHKYGARATSADGIRFDSAREARRYRELTLLQKAGDISRLEWHPRFSLEVVELKSAPTRTTAYRLRKRLVEAIHGITIREV